MIISINVDLKDLDRAALENMGVPDPIIVKLDPYLGLSGQAAYDAQDDTASGTALTLTQEEADELGNKVLQAKIESIEEEYNTAVGKIVYNFIVGT